jgi:tetratricopeptide (TPR) repeat protein
VGRVRGTLRSSGQRWRRRARRAWRRVRRTLAKTRLRTVLLSPILLPWRMIAAAGRFAAKRVAGFFKWLRRAWRRRKMRRLVQGLPALLTALLVGMVAVAVGLQKATLTKTYGLAAGVAIKNEDFKAAKIYLERLTELDGGQDATRYDLALTLEKLGNRDRAAAIMQSLAPADRTGFGRAHRWQAAKLLTDRETYKSPELLRLAERHLLRAQEAEPDSPDVQWELAQLYAATGRGKLAIAALQKAARQSPQFNYELGVLSVARGESQLAREAFEKADAHFQKEVGKNPDDQNSRLRWAAARMNLGDFQWAVKILSDGLTRHPDGPFRKVLADFFAAQYDRLRQTGKAKPGELLTMLRRALEFDAKHSRALERLVDFGEGGGRQASEAKELLQSMLAQGQMPATVHLALGTKAWEKDDLDKAQLHLELAYKLDPALAPVANNLAWVLAQRDKPDLERALRIMDSVLRRWPDVPAYRDTRGQILVKMQRWKDALDDLEIALPAMAKNRELHAAMAKAYEMLGMPEMAKKHLELGKEEQKPKSHAEAQRRGEGK